MKHPDPPPEIEIEPISFRPDPPPGRATRFAVLKWVLGSAAIVFLAGLMGVAGFVFTAKQVMVDIAPKPDRFSIEGGVISPRFGGYYLLRPGRYGVQAERQGYHPIVEQITVSDEKRQTFKFGMEKLPGRISLTAHRSEHPDMVVDGAAVIIDGVEIGKTPIKETAVKAGRRQLVIRADNYQPFKAEFQVEGMGASQLLSFSLLPGWADVTVRSVPEGADVFVDGVRRGNTPLTIRLAEGSYELALRAAQFKPWKTQLAVTANQPVDLDSINLSAEDGILSLSTQPDGAGVTIGGRYAGQTPLRIPLKPEILHTIQVAKAGFGKESRNVTVGVGEEKKIHLPLSPQMGVVHLTVTPSGATLFIDGKRRGPPPEKLELLAVQHDLEIRKAGYKPFSTRITPRPGFPQELTVALEKTGSTGKTEASAATAHNGYALTLIRPGSYTMGSSRREQGRRSNESLRKIVFKRPFFMGKREVTNREFKAYLSSHNSGAFKTEMLNRGDQPVVRITWKQAALYCNWLSQKQGLPPVYTVKGDTVVADETPATGYRLPTEAEWEYCARFAKKGGMLKYPWGDRFPPPNKTVNIADVSARNLLPAILENYEDGYPVSAPVGVLGVNQLGISDLGGNVAEWCHDYYTIYPFSTNKAYSDPGGPATGKHHVVRGAGWQDAGISALRAAYRGYGDAARPDLGFRVCRYAK